MFSGQKKAHHDCSRRWADHQQDYDEKYLSVRTALISKLTSSSSRKLSPIGTSSSKSRSPTCNSPLRIRRSPAKPALWATIQDSAYFLAVCLISSLPFSQVDISSIVLRNQRLEAVGPTIQAKHLRHC